MADKTLLIFAHPGPKRHNHLILENILSKLDEAKEEYDVLDLYKIKYDPVLKSDELYTHGRKNVTKQNKKFQEKIAESTNLIFIFPVWWNNMPAILKGFMERVLVSGFAFKYRKIVFNFSAPLGKLQGKKAAVFLTSGSPKWIFRLVLGNRVHKVIKNDMLRFCGIKAKVFHYGQAEKPITKETEKKIDKLTKKGLKWLMR